MHRWMGGLLAVSGTGLAGLYAAVRQRNLQCWLGASLRQTRGPALPLRSTDEPLDVFIAVCDHFEPEWGRPGRAVSRERVADWCREYPRQFQQYHDSTGRPPQHTFFFPADEYAPEYLDALAELCRAGFGDVDVHLHHDHDTAENLRETLLEYKQTLHDRHGLLRRDQRTGDVVYGFIHGNWALCNSRPDGRWCGVNEELDILQETGCYADFTFPSAPSDTQPNIINNIYYAKNCPGRSKSHERGIPAHVGVSAPDRHLLLIQGPLLLNWKERKAGVFPRIENGDLTQSNPPSWERFKLWVGGGVHVDGASRQIFVKLHTHGCQTANSRMWLGGAAARFHAELARHAAQMPNFRYHYVTAWELAQRVHQLEQLEASPPALREASPRAAAYKPESPACLPR